MKDTFGSRLKRSLDARGLSIRKFQKLMASTSAEGASYPAIHRALHNKNRPHLSFIEEAAALLDVEASWLAFGTSTDKRSSLRCDHTQSTVRHHCESCGSKWTTVGAGE